MKKAAAVIGGGVIGGGWVARFLLMGWDVRVFDTDPVAEVKINAVLANARRSLPGLYEVNLPVEGALIFSNSVEEAVGQADWIQECTPERLELKHTVLKQIQDACSRHAIIGSSTSGYKPSELHVGSEFPEQIIVAHPFNPVYLIPLVELVGPATTIEKAHQILTDLGMLPLHVRKEIDAHIADRFLEAVWREALWLINDGIATTQEIDDAIRYGFGLRWAQMGLFETYRIAGGEAGMAHFLAQFGPCLKWPWTKLMDVPELTDELVDKISSQSDQQSGMHSIRELEQIRDDNLVSIMRALKPRDWGAGELLNQQDDRLRALDDIDSSQPIQSIKRAVPIDWTDYNGHMNEARYAQAFSDAADFMMKVVGADEAYIASGMSYFTVDTRIKYLEECAAAEVITVSSRVLEGQGKKYRLFHTMTNADGVEVATADQLLIHVSLETRRACEPREEVSTRLQAIAAAHAKLPAIDV